MSEWETEKPEGEEEQVGDMGGGRLRRWSGVRRGHVARSADRRRPSRRLRYYRKGDE